MKSKEEDTRYPHTYACDYIRGLVGYYKDDDGKVLGTKLSRSDAVKIYDMIAELLNIPAGDLAKKLADVYLEVQDEMSEKNVRELTESLLRR